MPLLTELGTFSGLDVLQRYRAYGTPPERTLVLIPTGFRKAYGAGGRPPIRPRNPPPHVGGYGVTGAARYIRSSTFVAVESLNCVTPNRFVTVASGNHACPSPLFSTK